MLKRIITALILAPIAVALTVFLPNVWFTLLIGLVFLFGLREWHHLSGCDGKDAIFAGGLFVGLMLVLYQSSDGLYFVSALGAAYWFFQVFSLKTWTTVTRRNSFIFIFSSVTVLLSAWAALVLLHQYTPQGPIMAIGFMAAIWAADSFAYFVGKAYGKRKLAPHISPGKTVEGVVGGAVGSVLFAILFCYFSPFMSFQTGVLWSGLVFLAALISVVGDLYESRLKRSAGEKDSGTLLPGHGGVLDRIDGLVAATPVFVALFLS